MSTHQETIENSTDYELLSSIAARTTDNGDRDLLLDHENDSIRAVVATFGTEAHRQHYVNDVCPGVRETAALFGSPATKAKFIGDVNPLVRAAALPKLKTHP